MAVFVDQAVPGDQVLLRITRKKKNYAEARVMELLKASPDRIKPPCIYSGFCGGCKWQFLEYAVQLKYTPPYRHRRYSATATKWSSPAPTEDG
jgi:23S rRNA (uracil1939-C5)-methyltransferase